MKQLYGDLLQMALGVGLLRREVFVERLSRVLEQKMQASPEQGVRYAEELMDLLARWREQLRSTEGSCYGNSSAQNASQHSGTESSLSEQLSGLREQIQQLSSVLNRM